MSIYNIHVGNAASILCAIPMNIGLCFAYSTGYIVSVKAM